MIGIGKVNSMKVLRFTAPGAFLGYEDEEQDILLPNKYIPEGLEIDAMIDVFIYRDSEDRLIATTLTPTIQRDEFAYLKVKEVNAVGAFLEWGLEKDLLVPFKEQREPMEVGKSYLVYLYLDVETWRLVASSKVQKYIEREEIEAEVGEEVDLLLYETTDLGVNAIINNLYTGLIFRNEIFKSFAIGDRLTGYIKDIRPDKKISLSLEPMGTASLEPNADKLWALLQANGGLLPCNDKTAPEIIYEKTGMSKKNFKKAVGVLYKARKIMLEENGIKVS
jgi:predicted RNA-binding protein (virulence factor B family)